MKFYAYIQILQVPCVLVVCTNTDGFMEPSLQNGPHIISLLEFHPILLSLELWDDLCGGII